MKEQELSEEGQIILESMRGSKIRAWLRGIVGASIGGAVGWFAFGLLMSQGMYGLALPGATVGLGFALLARRPLGITAGLFCAVAGLLLMACCEWQIGAFKDDNSFLYLLTHLHQVDSSQTIMFLVLGTVFAFWFGCGR